MANLMKVIEAGNKNILAEQKEFEQRWTQHIAQIDGSTDGLIVDNTGLDDDIKDMVNLYGGQPLTQLVFLGFQNARSLARLNVLTQAMAVAIARMGGQEVEAPATEAAAANVRVN